MNLFLSSSRCRNFIGKVYQIPGIESFIERHIKSFAISNNNNNKIAKIDLLLSSLIFVEETLSVDFESLSNSRNRILHRATYNKILRDNNNKITKIDLLLSLLIFVEETLSVNFERLSNSKMKIPGIESFIERHMIKSSRNK